MEYHKRGWNVIPIIPTKKKPPKGCKWTKYQTERVTEDKLKKWFSGGQYKNLAVIAGAVSGLVIVDFDRMDLYERWKAQNAELAAKLPTVKTSRGMHVYCRSDGAENAQYPKIDVLATKKYALLPPSIHPDKAQYQWVTKPNGELPIINLTDWKLDELTEETEDTERHRRKRGNMGGGCTCNKQEERAPNVESVSEFTEESKTLIDQAIIATQPQQEGERNRRIFDLCRYLKAIPELAGLQTKNLKPIVRQWHQRALPMIGTKPFDDTWADFCCGWPKVKYPKGEDTVRKAVQKALDAQDTLPEAEQFDSDDVKLLIRVCYELQQLTTPKAFFLSCRKAEGFLGVSHQMANKYLNMLVEDEILHIEEKHTPTRATRYKYAGPSWTSHT